MREPRTWHARSTTTNVATRELTANSKARGIGRQGWAREACTNWARPRRPTDFSGTNTGWHHDITCRASSPDTSGRRKYSENITTGKHETANGEWGTGQRWGDTSQLHDAKRAARGGWQRASFELALSGQAAGARVCIMPWRIHADMALLHLAACSALVRAAAFLDFSSLCSFQRFADRRNATHCARRGALQTTWLWSHIRF